MHWNSYYIMKQFTEKHLNKDRVLNILDVGFALFSEGLSEGLYDEYLESIDETIHEDIKKY